MHDVHGNRAREKTALMPDPYLGAHAALLLRTRVMNVDCGTLGRNLGDSPSACGLGEPRIGDRSRWSLLTFGTTPAVK